MISVRHIVVNVTSWLTSPQGDTRVDKVLRGRWSNTPLHLSLILEADFQSRTLKVNISHASLMFGRELFGEVTGEVFSSLLPVEAK